MLVQAGIIEQMQGIKNLLNLSHTMQSTQHDLLVQAGIIHQMQGFKMLLA